MGLAVFAGFAVWALFVWACLAAVARSGPMFAFGWRVPPPPPQIGIRVRMEMGPAVPRHLTEIEAIRLGPPTEAEVEGWIAAGDGATLWEHVIARRRSW